MLEVWKDIKGFEDSYQVSNLGRVRSLDRCVLDKNNNLRKFKSTYLKYRVAQNGYGLICMSKKNYLVHRLVAIHHISDDNLLLDVNHIDSNKLNNVSTNLEWVTKKQNTQHALLKNRFVRRYGVDNPRSIKVVQKNKNGDFLKIWDSLSDVKRELNLDIKSIIFCCKNKNYKSVGGYKWEYLNNEEDHKQITLVNYKL